MAVIGASQNPARIGGRPLSYCLSQRYEGRIFPVNEGRDEVQGLRAYRSIAELPEAPDVAIIAVPAAHAVRALEEVALRGTKGAIVLTSGFAESGEHGANEQRRMLAVARSHGMRLVGPNCLGLYNARIGYYATFTSSFEMGWPLPGRIGVVSQSGAYGAHLVTVLRKHGIGAPIFISTGNEADIAVGDAVAWMVDDPDIDVIALYLEGVQNAETFTAALEAARRARKPVVVLKAGSSARGKAAVRSHTASLAVDNAVIDAVLDELGAARAQTTEEMLDIVYLATQRKFPSANSLGMLTISGGAGVIVSDAAEAAGLAMPEMPQAAQARLKQLIPFASTANPVDCTAQVLNDMSLVGQFCDTMVEAGGYASILAFFTMVGGGASTAPVLRQQIAAAQKRHTDRLFVMSAIASPECIGEYEREGIAVYEDPSRAVRAIDAMRRFGAAFAQGLRKPVPHPGPISLPDRPPNEFEAKQILRRAGIPSAPEHLCADPESATAAAENLGYPVVLKLASAEIPHKTEIGGVILDVRDAGAVRASFDLLLQRADLQAPGRHVDGVIVARQLRGGIECVMGIQQDPVFGPVAMFGLGGIFVEAIGDVVFRRCPFGEDVALDMIQRIKGAKLLAGVRGNSPVDVPALALMLSRLSAFAHRAGPRLRSIDLNPVLAMPIGSGAYVLDALFELENARGTRLQTVAGTARNAALPK